MKNAVLIFDLDDTLLYQERVNHAIVRDFSLRLFPGVDPERLATQFFQTARELWEDLPTYPWTRMIGISAGEGLWGEFNGELPLLQQLRPLALNYRVLAWQETLERLGSSPSQRCAEALATDFYRERRSRVEVVDGAKELLGFLRPRYYLSLLTNGASDLQRWKIEASGLGGFFDHITVSGEFGLGKPRPEVFYAALEPFPPDLPKLMVGNSQTSDIQGAANAGIPSVWFDLGEDCPLPSLHPAAVVHALAEIPEVLARLDF